LVENVFPMNSLTAFSAALPNLSQWVLDQLYPPRCPSCAEPVAAQGHLCAPCFRGLHLIADPSCARCGIPFAVPMEACALCADCLDHPPLYDRARAALVYDEVVGRLVHHLKYHDRMLGLPRYAQWLEQVGAPLLAQSDCIVPVPLHWRRLMSRRYNQAAWLAYALAGRTGLPCLPGLLRRIRPTDPQARKNRAERLRAIQYAFCVPPRRRAQVAGKRVLLVDDVMTTGATMSACASALKEAGAANVSALALARTVRLV